MQLQEASNGPSLQIEWRGQTFVGPVIEKLTKKIRIKIKLD